MTKTQTTRTATLADVQVGDVVFQLGDTVMNRVLVVTRVDHFGKLTSIRYHNGGFVPAKSGKTKVVLSVHKADVDTDARTVTV